MTFYNIIFGILLVAAVGEMLRSLNHPNWLHLWEATSLALLVVSDVIFTSHVIEERKKPYSVSMKFLDLFNFFILSCLSALECEVPNLQKCPKRNQVVVATRARGAASHHGYCSHICGA
jgi:hypothetical protein